MRLFYCRDDLQMGIIRLSFWSYLGNMGGPSTVQPSWDRMKDAFNTFDWWRRRKWESRRIWIVSWYNAREPWHYVSCEVIIDVALSRIDNPKTRCAAIPSSHYNCSKDGLTDCGAGESVLSVDKRLIRACMSFLWLSFQSNGGGRDSLLFSTRFFFFFSFVRIGPNTKWQIERRNNEELADVIESKDWCWLIQLFSIFLLKPLGTAYFSLQSPAASRPQGSCGVLTYT